jgi:hypothetical protein
MDRVSTEVLLDGVVLPGFAPVPYRSLQRGPRLLVVPHGWPSGQHVAEVNPFREDAHELAAGLCAAVNGHRELLSALRITASALNELVRRPYPIAVQDAINALEVAHAALGRNAR